MGLSYVICLTAFSSFLCGSVVSMITVSISQHYGLLGGVATLRCNFKPISTNIVQIKWYKGNPNVNLIYQYKAVSRKNTGPVQSFDTRQVVGRLSEDGYHELTLNKSRKYDADFYQCTVFYDTGIFTGYITSELFKMQLVDLPVIKPEINYVVNANDTLLSDTPCNDLDNRTAAVPPINACGKDLLPLVCQSNTSSPLSTISWQTDDTRETIDTTPTDEGSGKTSSQARINNIYGSQSVVKCTVLSPNPSFGEKIRTSVCLRVQQCSYSTSDLEQVPDFVWIVIGAVVFAVLAILTVTLFAVVWLKRRKQRSRSHATREEEDMYMQLMDKVPTDGKGKTDTTVTNVVYFDINIGDKNAGRIKLGLFGKAVPRTVKKFVKLCKSENGYKGTTFHKVIGNKWIQCGEGVGDGIFRHENFAIKHASPGLLSTVTTEGADSGSQFRITTVEAGWLNDREVVFGKVLENLELVKKIESLEIDHLKRPKNEVTVMECKVENTETR